MYEGNIKSLCPACNGRREKDCPICKGKKEIAPDDIPLDPETGELKTRKKI